MHRLPSCDQSELYYCTVLYCTVLYCTAGHGPVRRVHLHQAGAGGAPAAGTQPQTRPRHQQVPRGRYLVSTYLQGISTYLRGVSTGMHGPLAGRRHGGAARHSAAGPRVSRHRHLLRLLAARGAHQVPCTELLPHCHTAAMIAVLYCWNDGALAVTDGTSFLSFY